MLRKTISMTEAQNNWIKAQVESGRYGNDSEYIRDLLRKEQDRHEAEFALGKLLDGAEKSGLSEQSPLDIWHKALADSRHQAGV